MDDFDRTQVPRKRGRPQKYEGDDFIADYPTITLHVPAETKELFYKLAAARRESPRELFEFMVRSVVLQGVNATREREAGEKVIRDGREFYRVTAIQGGPAEPSDG